MRDDQLSNVSEAADRCRGLLLSNGMLQGRGDRAWTSGSIRARSAKSSRSPWLEDEEERGSILALMTDPNGGGIFEETITFVEKTKAA